MRWLRAALIHTNNARLALARATQRHLHAFGLDWDDIGGVHDGHFAPFHWQSCTA